MMRGAIQLYWSCTGVCSFAAAPTCVLGLPFVVAKVGQMFGSCGNSHFTRRSTELWNRNCTQRLLSFVFLSHFDRNCCGLASNSFVPVLRIVDVCVQNVLPCSSRFFNFLQQNHCTLFYHLRCNRALIGVGRTSIANRCALHSICCP